MQEIQDMPFKNRLDVLSYTEEDLSLAIVSPNTSDNKDTVLWSPTTLKVMPFLAVTNGSSGTLTIEVFYHLGNSLDVSAQRTVDLSTTPNSLFLDLRDPVSSGFSISASHDVTMDFSFMSRVVLDVILGGVAGDSVSIQVSSGMPQVKQYTLR